MRKSHRGVTQRWRRESKLSCRQFCVCEARPYNFSLNLMRRTLLARDELLIERAALRAAGQKLVFTNGVFDLLHVGHVRYLAQAREMGDALIVAINSDESVRALKGPDRPLVAEEERAEMLGALRSVDYVTIFGE